MSAPLIAVAIPARYPLVAVAGIGMCWLTGWQGYVVGKMRKAAQIEYPRAYADKIEAETKPEAHKFNCAQRAHQNTLENLTQNMFAMFFFGIRYPTLSATFGASWVIGRIFYTRGYITGDPAKRNAGLARLQGLGLIGLILGSTFTAGQMVYELINY